MFGRVENLDLAYQRKSQPFPCLLNCSTLNCVGGLKQVFSFLVFLFFHLCIIDNAKAKNFLLGSIPPNSHFWSLWIKYSILSVSRRGYQEMA